MDRDVMAARLERELAAAVEGRARAEAALAALDERFRLAARATNDAIWDWNFETNHLVWNEALAGNYGHAPEDVEPTGEWWMDHIHPEDRHRVDIGIHAAIENGSRSWSDEYRFLRADGSYANVLDRGHLIRDASGRAVRMIGAVLDLTEIHSNRNALAVSEARYRTLFEAVDAGFCVVEMRFEGDRAVDYRFIEANPAFERQTGLVNAVGRWATELVPDLEQHWFDLYGRVAISGRATRFESGSEAMGRWFDVHALRTGAPEDRRVAILFNDISDRKAAEIRLRELNETLEEQVSQRTTELRQFRDIVEATTAAICAFDRDHRVIAFNRAHNEAFKRVNGFETKVGDVFPDLFTEAQGRRMRALMDRALAGETFTVTEVFGREAFGQPKWEITYAPLRDDSGETVGAFHLATDISERLRAEADLLAAQEALRQSQKMEAMGSLTGGVAHDFNNLLTPIMGSLDLMQRQGLGGAREQRLIDGAMQSAERAKTLVQRLLAFARRQPLRPRPVDVGALVTGMGDLVRSTVGPNLEVVVDVASDLPSAVADDNQVEMAILNLSVNARDAMPDGGRLTISASAVEVCADGTAATPPGRYVQVRVTDSGVGMDAETLRRAVEPFFSTKGVGQGTGLGLSMVHGLAAQLGGDLTLESELGVGTTVTLWLPATEAPTTDAQQSPEMQLPTTTGLVLLVDDEQAVRSSTAEMLAELGYQVVEAASAEDAAARLDAGLTPDLLVTDHLMSGQTGTDLAREFQRRFPGRRVLVVSGYAEVDGIAADIARLIKPFRLSDLAASLTR